MFTRILRGVQLAVILLGMSACGGGVPPEYAPAPGADPRFDGEWPGVASVSLPDRHVVAVPLTIRMTAQGENVHAEGLCRGGTGRATASGIGALVEWRDTVICPAPTNSCPTASFVFTSGIFTITETGDVSMAAHGTYVVCDESLPIAMEFVAERRPASGGARSVGTEE